MIAIAAWPHESGPSCECSVSKCAARSPKVPEFRACKLGKEQAPLKGHRRATVTVEALAGSHTI